MSKKHGLDKQPLALIVEDEVFLAELFARALEAAEFETEIINNGRDALPRIIDTQPAVVVLDLHLPYVSGKEILQKIRENAQLADTPVIIITAYSHLAEELRGEATLVLLKPVTFDQVRDFAIRLRPPDTTEST